MLQGISFRTEQTHNQLEKITIEQRQCSNSVISGVSISKLSNTGPEPKPYFHNAKGVFLKDFVVPSSRLLQNQLSQKSPHQSIHALSHTTSPSRRSSKADMTSPPQSKHIFGKFLHPELAYEMDNKEPCTCGTQASSLTEKYGKPRQVLGKGSGGVVRLVEHKEEGKPQLFAVKQFRERFSNETEKEYLKKVTSEFCISSSLQHPNIIQTLDLIFEHDSNELIYEIMEYCEYQLFDIAQQGLLTIQEQDCYFKQLLNSIQYLQKMGIAHRDIKPENCVVNHDGILKLIDFGCAFVYRTPFEPPTNFLMLEGVCGSDPYIAPEIFTNESYDPRMVDLWSAAIVYFAISMAKLPWKMAHDSDPYYQKFIQNPQYRTKLFQSIPSKFGSMLLSLLLVPEPNARASISDVVNSHAFSQISMCVLNQSASNHYHNLPDC